VAAHPERTIRRAAAAILDEETSDRFRLLMALYLQLQPGFTPNSLSLALLACWLTINSIGMQGLYRIGIIDLIYLIRASYK
jgi:hypothetical protein